ncbi:MAG TPA: hypothetical protein VGN64_21310, partial [Dyadobacter sp.]|nr:hypothetical protein [Dyadobacter sp.]
MKKISAISAFIFHIILGISTSVSGQSDSLRQVHVGIVYPISSNGLKAADYSNRFSLHTIAGVSDNELAVAIAGGVNIIKHDAKGTTIAGIVNLIGNTANGAQIAGFSNIIRNNASGAQVAGVMNLAGSAEGVQIAGFSNITKGHAKGLQLSGFLNKAENVGNQIAGGINIAKTVKGVQLAGLINIADSSDYPIAILNFIKTGEKSVSLSIDETLTTMATFRSGGRGMYGILGVGYNLTEDDKSLFGIESGLGAHIPVANRFRINTEIVSQQLSDFKKGSYAKHHFRILPAY